MRILLAFGLLFLFNSKPKFPLLRSFLITLVWLPRVPLASAGGATWSTSLQSGDWNTAANWTPSTVPNSPTDVATFAVSSTTSVSLSADIEVSEIDFSSGASAYTFNLPPTVGATVRTHTNSFQVSYEGGDGNDLTLTVVP